MGTVDQVAAGWLESWKKILPAARAIDGWTAPWLDESARDGNPVFSAWSPDLSRGVRVVAHPQVEQWSFWRNRFAEGTPDEVDELVLSVPLAAPVAHDATIGQLLESWIRDGRAELMLEMSLLPTPLAA